MGRRELLEALQREGREKVAAITARRAATEERLRAEKAHKIDELRQKHQKQHELLCNSRKRTLVAQASREAALIRLRAEHALALRLHERARHALPQLYADDAQHLFAQLAAELPLLPWQTIWTTPGAISAASALFPTATIVADPALAGGIKAATTENHLTVDNTLETRLEKLWPDLLPRLMEELREAPP
jgi:vacuolar-type H+-ATPase subunit E/Vma4